MPMDTADLTVRPARDADAGGLIALVGGCFDEYPGCVLDLDGLDTDLKAIASTVTAAGGAFWVAEAPDGRLAGSVGWVPVGQGIELKRLYIDRRFRRRGLATRLFDLVLAAADKRGASHIELWSDTRFAQSHAFYTAHGFTRQPETRDLNDPSNSTEYRFVRHV